ncbi:MAG: FAD-binding protein [candidate division Zixibacteria bacterium]|nr:FAD-binding protein [candidate division Zixibacteria bacterium]
MSYENSQILFQQELSRFIPIDQIHIDSAFISVYSSDASIYNIKPTAVVTVQKAEDIVDCVNACRKLGIPITSRAGATGLAGGAVGDGVILDFCDYDQGIQIDGINRIAQVSSGVIYDDLNLRAAKYRLMFPPDPSSGDSCRIGGMLGNNSSGSRTVRYGTTRDYTTGLEIVTASGKRLFIEPLKIDSPEAHDFFIENPEFEEILNLILRNRDIILPRRRNVRKNSTGYDLWSFIDRYDQGWIDFTKILVGSEGTLCIFDSAHLQLEPLPPRFFTVLLYYKAFKDVAPVISRLLKLKPYSLEVADKNSMDLIGREEYGIPQDADVMLLMQFELGMEEEIKNSINRIVDPSQLSIPPVIESDPVKQKQLWAARKALLPAFYKHHPVKKPLSFVEDACLPPEKLPEMFEFVGEVFDKYGIEYGGFGHIGDGNIHLKPLVDASDADDRRKMQLVSYEIYNEVLRLGGVISGEHADGRVRSPFLRLVYGEEVYSIFRQIKHILDPDNILNPGVKLTSETDITQNIDGLRLNWDCSQCGKCVPSCPSFEAHRSELYSPRGRIKMRNFPGLITTDRKESLETCINCKNCKIVCPADCDASTDANDFKGESRRILLEPMFYAMTHPLIMRSGNALGAVGLRFAQNKATRELLEKISERAMRISKDAILPEPAVNPFASKMKENQNPEAKVAYFFGCADGYLENPTSWKILKVFDEQNTPLAIPTQVCCGVPAESYGFKEYALKSAMINIESLNRFDYIIASCGTCVNMLKEYPHLFRTNDPFYTEAKKLASKVYEVSEFLLRHGNNLRTESQAKVTYHDSCHLRCSGVTAEPRRFLREIGADFVEMDYADRCCGFAGTHYFSNPAESGKIFNVKRDALEESGAKVVASCCPTCILQFKYQQEDAESVHPILLVKG